MSDAVGESLGAEPQRGVVGRLEKLFASERATRLIYLVIGAVVIGLVFRHLQYSTGSICCGDFDGYYHIRWSRLLWEGIRSGQFPPRFTWLPLTTLDPQSYVDHHLLFHILQIPFTWFGDLTAGAKVAATLFGSLAVFSCYWLIVRYRINYTLVWLLALLACAGPFLYRLNMAKAPPIAIIFMVAGIYLLFEKRYWMLGPLMFLFVWTYSLFPTLFVAAVIWLGVMAWSEGRLEWRPVAWTGAGMVAGLIVNPYFPKNIRLLWAHMWMKLTPGDFSTEVGQEWYPYDTKVFLGNCLIACIAMLVGYIAFNWNDRQRSARPLFFLIFSTLLMVATFRSRRYVEYWPPFAVLFAAFSLQQLWESARGVLGSLPAEMLDELQPFLDREAEAEKERATAKQELWKTVAACVVAVFLFVTLFINIRGVPRLGIDGVAGEIAGGDGPEQYRKGMEWIRANVPAGERIFNTDWDDFPKMFFYDTTHSYISGLDPTYLLDKNKELAELYEDITVNLAEEDAVLIRNSFGARYVFSDRQDNHRKFYCNAMRSGWFEQVYAECPDCFILRIRDERGEPSAAVTYQCEEPQGTEANAPEPEGEPLPGEDDLPADGEVPPAEDGAP